MIFNGLHDSNYKWKTFEMRTNNTIFVNFFEVNAIIHHIPKKKHEHFCLYTNHLLLFIRFFRSMTHLQSLHDISLYEIS